MSYDHNQLAAARNRLRLAAEQVEHALRFEHDDREVELRLLCANQEATLALAHFRIVAKRIATRKDAR